MRRLLPLLLLLLATPGLAQDGVPAMAPGQTTISSSAEGRIAGELLDARSGEPVSGAVIALYHPRTPRARQWPEPWVPENPNADETPTATVRTASEGQFLFDGLVPGTYRVAPMVAAGSQVTSAELVLTPEAGRRYVELKTNLGGRIDGRVVDPQGAPLGGVFVYVAGFDDGRGGNLFAGQRPTYRTVSDADGTYSLSEVPPGHLFVQAGRRDRGYSPLVELRVGQAADLADVDLVVPDDTARIERGQEQRGGLGVVVDFDADGVKIRRLLPEMPAVAAGLQTGDRILAMEGRSTRWMMRFEFFSRARGGVGEPLTLTIARGDAPPFDVTIERARMPDQ